VCIKYFLLANFVKGANIEAYNERGKGKERKVSQRIRSEYKAGTHAFH